MGYRWNPDAGVVRDDPAGIEPGWLSVSTFTRMLKTPVYVKRTNLFLDTSPMVARTVRMETCGQVIRDITKAYGVDTRMDLWRPGDPQPDAGGRT